MTPHRRRAASTKDRKALDRGEALRLACDYLANVAGPTATGITLILPNGDTAYVSVEDARAFHGKGEPGGQA